MNHSCKRTIVSVLLSLVIILCTTPTSLATNLESMLHRNEESLDFDAIMGVSGEEVMLDDTFIGTAYLYQYDTNNGMMEAAQALFDQLISSGYSAEEATLDTLPAVRFVKDGAENVLLAPHTERPFAYVAIGQFTTDTGYVVIEENGITYYEDVAHQYRTTLNHADIFIDGEKVSGFTTRCSPVLSGTKDLFTFSCGDAGNPDYLITMGLPIGYMEEGGTYEREQFVGTDLNCMIMIGGYYDGYSFSTADEMERFDDVSFTFSPVSHDQPVAVQFSISYNYMGERHLIEGFTVVTYEGASTGGTSSSSSSTTCSICHGSGTCQVCMGRGYVTYTTWGQGGSGKVTCTSCNGSGKCKYCKK